MGGHKSTAEFLDIFLVIVLLLVLLKDECEEVEHQCQKTIQQLEVILGESLQSYF